MRTAPAHSISGRFARQVDLTRTVRRRRNDLLVQHRSTMKTHWVWEMRRVWDGTTHGWSCHGVVIN
jgi:hypothetical protein